MDPTNENSSSISSDLIRGHINTIILRTLYDGDKYGYEIINEIEEKSKGQYSLKQPTLYSALKRLEGQDYVTSYWGGVSNGGRRKYFQITDKGKQIVEQNLAEWEYSRTVIDSLISEKDFDFNNPPPSAVDFSLLKKSTTRIPMSGDLAHDDIDLDSYMHSGGSANTEGGEEDSAAETEAAVQEPSGPSDNAAEQQPGADGSAESVSILQSAETYEDIPCPIENTYTSETVAETSEDIFSTNRSEQNPDEVPQSAAAEAGSSQTYTENAQSPEDHIREEQIVRDTWIDEEQRRIQHENYRNLVGNDDDATAYYYAQVARQNRENAAAQHESASVRQEAEPPVQEQQPYADSTDYAQEQSDASAYDETYLENRAISSELLYSNRSPAERNYKDLLSRLYDNTRHPEEDADIYDGQPEPEPYIQTAPQQPDSPEPSVQTAPPVQETAAYTDDAAPASNVEFYDIEEQAENDGIRITTSNGARSRASVKTVGNVFDKGKALFMSALYVFVIALVECIINLCIRNAIHSHPAYVVLPFVAAFVMFGVFLFLYLKGFGKNSRKTQSKSYISASLILFANLVIIICLIAYLMIYNANNGVSFIQILKYGILPCIFMFNIPLFAIFYSYHSNKQ